MDKPSADPLIGTTIAQYEVVARLGGGGMGIVYAARDTRLGRRVALKFLPPQWSQDESAKQRFIREAQAASSTDHRNICTIHDIETAADGQLFIVMAHYDGQTLKQRLDAGPLPVDEAVDIAAQVAEGLAKAHAQGVIHRDIKPGNLIVTDDGVKILDFGLAKLAAESLRLTLEGTTIGTVAYMSPEQSRGDDADPRSDVWALGVVLYEMLAGQAPFRGAYAEAISYAIRTETPAPLRRSNPDIPDALERLVFRALDKDPQQRIQSAREFARELRLLQGRTLPVDLRTEPVARPHVAAREGPPYHSHGTVGRAAHHEVGRAFTARRKSLTLAALLLAILVGASLWVFSPVDRIPVAVAPVVNQTGYAELDPYRLALTKALIDHLGDARGFQVLPYERLLQIVRRYDVNGSDISSRAAVEALATNSGAQMVVVPTLLYENGGWKARVEFRDAASSTSRSQYETPAAVSSLMKETIYSLMTPLAAGVDDYFTSNGPPRARVAALLRAAVGRGSTLAPRRMATLDAEADFARGLDAYEQQEYSAALQSFASAAQRDARSALARAWISRAARVMRHDQEAIDAAQAAAGLLSNATNSRERLFVEAVAAESRRDLATAEARLRALVAMAPDEAMWTFELASFLDREGRPGDAIAAHLQALALDPRLVRPHLDLCRLYNPNELAAAQQHGQLALAAYKRLGARAGEAQSLWCLADILRLGSPQDVEEARRSADAALAIIEELGYPYNRSRALNYVALAAGAQQRFAEAVAAWERALAEARAVGNEALQPLMLMNLAVADVRLGKRAQAVDYYQQSARGFEALGQEQRAAELQANAGAILIENSVNPEQGLRDVQNAVAVARKLGNRNFEVLGAQLTAAYYRNAGRHQEAERELNRALALARERDLKDDLVALTIDIARSRIETGDYANARTLLVQSLATAGGGDRTHARIRLGQALARMGDLDGARQAFAQAEADLQNGADAELAPVLDVAIGQLAYESGQPDVARTRVTRAAALWTDTFPDAASVEARAYLGLLDALQGRVERGLAHVRAALEQATKMRRVSLQARCQLFLAQIALARQRIADARMELDRIPADDPTRTIGATLRAEVEALRSRILAARPS